MTDDERDQIIRNAGLMLAAVAAALIIGATLVILVSLIADGLGY